MSDNRKYYYLKLKENYFDDDSIVLLESMQDGVLYSNVLLKLHLKSLKHGGRLQLDEDIPYTVQMIATITRQQIGTVERALQIFLKLGLVEVLDSGTFYMSNIELLIGQSSTEAERKRAARLQNKALSAPRTNGGHLSDIRPPEIEIELEKEIEIKREIEKGHPTHAYGRYQNVFLPKDYVFLNYLRCHDDIGWGLDYATLQQEGIEERAHKKYLNDYFQGFAGDSNSRGVLYNEDPVTGDARFCGTTASMCGIEKAGFEKDKAAMKKAIQMDVMLHAYMFMQSGIPVLYSGDEIGQVNDYSYKNDPDKAPDSRYIHRGAMHWDRAAKCDNPRTVEGQLFGQLNKLEKIRKSEKAFMTNADTWTVETWDNSVLCIGRYYDGDKIYGLFNFSESDKTAWINERDGLYKDLITGKVMEAAGVNIPAYGFYWLKKQ